MYYFSGKTNRSYLSIIFIILFSTLLLILIICIIIGSIIVRKKLRKIGIMSKTENVLSIELCEENNNENYYEIIDNTLDDNIIYNEINYGELNVETTIDSQFHL